MWALVGIVDHDYSDTTSDSQILVIFDFRIVSEPMILDGKARYSRNHLLLPLGRG